ncbi:DUF359 domain-containing protein [Candidatus Lokiarchaeum ossiferum]|uniref:DUF359 domain-containing protein n=1 Tax=Candidatus Lokiarchaeum ossiferum TaxID=2951803 RepID=UPI00352E97B4
MYYRLTRDMRKFTSPEDLMGNLFEGSPEISIPKAINWIRSIDEGKFLRQGKEISPKNNPVLICVGDVVSQALLSHPELCSFVKYCFIDGETQRGGDIKIPSLSEFKYISFLNPRGMIADDIFAFIRKTISNSNQYIIKINGEEDLLVVPAVLETSNCFIFYGQPPLTDLGTNIPSGCVGIFNDDVVKAHFQEIFDQMEPIEKI